MKEISRKNINKYQLISFFIAIVAYILYIPSIENMSESVNEDILIFILCWFGIIIAMFTVVSWKNITGKYFSLYTIFMLFFFLFNYGQCIMWALGIHMPDEIGKSSLYPGWGVASNSDIIKVQLLTLSSILMFHSGSTLCFKGSRRLNQKSINKIEDSITLDIMFKICSIIGVIVIPITLYKAFDDFKVAQMYGYRALYYSDYANSSGVVVDILSRMFFPCIIGILIGSRFSKKVSIFTIITFILYFVLNMLSGDRGSWIYKIIILVWLSHTYYKNIDWKKFIIYLILSVVAMYIIDAMVSLRNIGITYENIIEVLSIDNAPIVSTIFEMGTSMKPSMILQKYGWDIWPSYNSYLLAVLTMVTNKVIQILNVPIITIGSWFSQGYLGISYGAGFSIIAEALMNFGPYFSPLVLFILGYFISSLIYVDKNVDYRKRPLKVLFAVSTLNSFLTITRGYFHYQLKDWFYGVLILCSIIYIVKKYEYKNIKSKRV